MALVVEQRTPGARRIAEDDLGEDDTVPRRGDPRHDAADEPGEHVVQDGNAFRSGTPLGGRAEAVGAAAGEGGGQFPLMLAEYVHADVTCPGDPGPTGGSGT